jgi:hypothetical protein
VFGDLAVGAGEQPDEEVGELPAPADLVADYAFPGSYQRVKMFLAEARPRIAAELGCDDNPLSGLHRRFEVVPSAQGQVDWGEEGDLLGDGRPVYSFHLVLSYSRDPFCCFTTAVDQATFFACHRRAFAHFGGVPGALVYDRTKTIVPGMWSPRRAPRWPPPTTPTGAAHPAATDAGWSAAALVDMGYPEPRSTGARTRGPGSTRRKINRYG